MWIATCLFGLVGIAVSQQQGEKGAKLLGAGEGLLETMGGTMDRAEQELYEDVKSRLRDLLDEEEFERVRQEGGAMSMEQAITYALGGTIGD